MQRGHEENGSAIKVTMVKPWLLLFRGLLTLLSGVTLPDVEGVVWEHWAFPRLSEVES